ncbi:MAG: hypothetical protein ACYC0X_29750 [Pirellulaceae bacterium]
MSTDRDVKQAGESFQQRLQKLRRKIDTLSETQRPHLIDLADTIARQHRQLQNRVSPHHDTD